MSDEALPELFAEALALDESERRAWLAKLERRDPDLATELARLLAGAETPSRLLDRTPWPIVAGVGVPAEDAALPGRIGPYRILGELGHGGMGRVYLAAEETDDFERTIALKVIDRPAPDALRRFRDEVRILSSLEHPGIARFIHGGRAPEGTWFLALEYVEGDDLVAYARSQALPVARRIELFLAVLEAVEFAHRRGVVHRDLKPGHLLVGHDGRPRLLDFGISKLLDPETQESLSVTRTDARALTPAYASPEQFRGEPVTPASDIYSLGVVLYELLAGHRPFATGSDSRAALERAVLGTDPEPPSHAAKRTGGGSPTGRDSRPPQSAFGRDLDAICLKALRKEPGDRYASAADFAADLQRYLDRRPVLAHRGGRRYRALRFAGRHRAGIVTGAALALALAALVFAWRAQPEDSDARPLETGTPVAPATGTETIEELERRFAAAPGSLEAGSQLAAGLVRASRVKEAAVVVGRLRQLPGAADDPLVDHTDAMVAINQSEHQRGLALETKALANARPRGRADLVPEIRSGRAAALSAIGRQEEGHAELLLARREAEELNDQAVLAVVLNDLAVDELMRGNLRAGERLLAEALVPARSLPDASRLGYVLENLAGLAVVRGRPDLAEARYREAMATFTKVGRKRRAAATTGALSEALRDLGRDAEAAALRQQATTALAEVNDPVLLADIRFYGASAQLEAGLPDAAEHDAAAIDAAAQATGNRKILALAETMRGRVAWVRGDLANARRHLDEASRLHVADGDLDLASEIDVGRAEAELALGATDVASRWLDEALARLDGAAGTTTAFLADALRVRIEASAGRLADAQARLEKLGDQSTSPSLTRRLAFLAARGTLAASRGKLDEAESDFRTAVAAAEGGARRVAAFELRLDLAALARRADSSLAGPLAREVERAAAPLGLRQLESRAQRIQTLRQPSKARPLLPAPR